VHGAVSRRKKSSPLASDPRLLGTRDRAAEGRAASQHRVTGGAATSSALAVERFVLVFFLLAYALWQFQFGIVRYAAPLEATAPIVMVLLVQRVFRRQGLQALAITVASVAFLTQLRPIKTERIPWARKYIEVQAPRLEHPEKALVVVAHNAPWTFVLPFFQPEIRVLGLKSNLTKPWEDTRFQQEMRNVLASHAGDIYLLTDNGYLREDLDTVGKYYGLVRTEAPFLRVATQLQSIPIYLCPVRRGEGSATAASRPTPIAGREPATSAAPE